MNKKLLSLIVILLFLPVRGFAFEFFDESGQQILGKRDLECIALTKSKDGGVADVVFALYSAHLFQDFTAKNLNKKLEVRLCGKTIVNAPIKSVIVGGPMSIALAKDDVQCLEASFKISKKCRLCPVCKD
jgi:hypothetical protein